MSIDKGVMSSMAAGGGGILSEGAKNFRLNLIGPFGLFDPDGNRIEISSKKAIGILAALAMAPDGIRTRVWLQNALWGSRGTKQAQSSLRRELSNLRRHFKAPWQKILEGNNARIQLDLGQVDVDARSINAGDSELLAHIAATRSDFLEGLDISDADVFEDWLREERASLERKIETWSERDADHSEAITLVKATKLPQPVKPSIAVLPFQNLSNEDHDYFAEGILEEIAQKLSEYPTLFVVSGGSVLGSNRTDANYLEVAEQLGVQYLLAGSVRRFDEQVRVTVKLLHGSEMAQVWSKTFSGLTKDSFVLQQQIADAVAPRVDSRIEKSERTLAVTSPLSSHDAHQLYWRANAMVRRWDRESMTNAVTLAKQFLELEPENPWGLSLAAFCNGSCYGSGWTDNPEATRKAAKTYLNGALRTGEDDPFVLGYGAGTLISISEDVEAADKLINRALDINPNFSASLFWGGWVDISMGNMARALDRFKTALRLNPQSAVRPYSITGIGVSLLALGQLDDSISILEEAINILPDYPLTLAGLCVACALTGKTADAKSYAERLDKKGGVEPLKKMIRNPAHQKMLLEGIALAKAELK